MRFVQDAGAQIRFDTHEVYDSLFTFHTSFYKIGEKKEGCIKWDLASFFRNPPLFAYFWDMHKTWINGLIRLCQTGTLLLIVATVLAGMGDEPYWIGLFAHFRLHLAIAAFICALVFIVGVKWRWFVMAALVLATNLVEILPAYRRPSPPPAQGARVSFFALNVLWHNAAYDQVIAQIKQQQPDLVLLVEATYQWAAAIDSSDLISDYRFRMMEPRYGYTGMLLLSKFPLSEKRMALWADARFPTLSCRVHPPGQHFRLYGMHPSAPPDSVEIIWRNQILTQLAQDIRSRNEPVIVLGDCNLTPYHVRFKQFLAQAGLKDSRIGFGYQASFPSRWGLIGLPLDHALVSPDIRIHARKIGPDVGSDHRPLQLVLQLP